MNQGNRLMIHNREGVNMKQITAMELENKMKAGEKVNIVDVRTSGEVAKGRIIGAKHIPLSEIMDQLHEFVKNEQYYLVCTRGDRSGVAAELLNQNGFVAMNVIDGMVGWKGGIE